MGPTFNEVRYSVFNKVKPLYSDDNMINIELCGHIVNNCRSQIMKDWYKEKKYLDRSFYQYAEGLDMNCVKVLTQGLWGGKNELIVDVPQLAGWMGYLAIEYFGPPGFTLNYRYVALSNIRHVNNEKYTSDSPCYAMIGARLFIRNPPDQGIKFMSMVAAFDIPYVNYNNKVTAAVNDALVDYEYPFPSAQLYKLELMAYNDIIQTYKNERQTVEINDAKDNG